MRHAQDLQLAVEKGNIDAVAHAKSVDAPAWTQHQAFVCR
jgi:hypothetical protein